MDGWMDGWMETLEEEIKGDLMGEEHHEDEHRCIYIYIWPGNIGFGFSSNIINIYHSKKSLSLSPWFLFRFHVMNF